MSQTTNNAKGGQFFLSAISADDLFTPEDLTDEHRMISRLAQEFVEKEVLPHRERLEDHDFDRVVQLLKQAGELGLLAHSVPESYEGLGLDKITKALVSEQIGRGGGYSVAHLNHTCIATLPITYFGTPEQKATYLPKLASGEFLGAYCLTEPSAGSDALSAKTTAVLNEDGTHFVLNGTKQFITNAGFADTFIVYAKVDGTKFTAFLVEKDAPGLKLGNEENKMGIRASSTRQVFLEDCLVPVDHVIGEIGRGHHIAFNVLNLGRFNLGAATIGGSKGVLQETITYVKNRQQFGRPLAAFPATMEKLANIAAAIYAGESLQYRTAHLLDSVLGDLYDETDTKVTAKALAEFAIECSVCKVFGSETLHLAVDEGVQMHGGYGFIKEYPIEQMYRDARINRIFEGTNEVNRLLIPGMLARKSASGELPMQAAIEKAMMEIHRGVKEEFDGPLAREQAMVSTTRRLFLAIAGLVFHTYGDKLDNEQETLLKLSDIGIALYAMESAVLRAVKAAENAYANAAHKADLAAAYAQDALLQVEMLARQLLASLPMGEAGAMYQELFYRQFAPFAPVGQVERKRRIALQVVEAGKYV